jgi:hypothetical protein
MKPVRVMALDCLAVGSGNSGGNAIFNATGLRLRSLPLTPKGIPPLARF